MRWELAALAACGIVGFVIGWFFGDDLLLLAVQHIHVGEVIGA